MPVQTFLIFFHFLKNTTMRYTIFNFIFISLHSFFQKAFRNTEKPLPNAWEMEMWEYAESVWVELK
jgi:hypothetical protein